MNLKGKWADYINVNDNKHYIAEERGDSNSTKYQLRFLILVAQKEDNAVHRMKRHSMTIYVSDNAVNLENRSPT